MLDIVEQIKKIQEQSFNQFINRQEGRTQWQQVCDSVDNLDNDYTYPVTSYHLAYLASHNQVYDASIIFLLGQKPVAIWPINLYKNASKWHIQTHCQGVMPPLCVDALSIKQRKVIYKQCLGFLELCQSAFQTNGVMSTFNTIENDLWLQTIAPYIQHVNYKHLLYLSLEQSIEQIKSNIRRRYRSYINKGLKLWQSQILTSVSLEQIEEIRLFHIKTAGKETRSVETWLQQREMVNNKQAFIVTLRETNGTLIGAAIFNYTKKQAMYSVGIYERSLFDFPIGHTVQMIAIEHMKKLSIRGYFIGYRDYPFEKHQPTEKQSAIGYFKEGFSNKVELEVSAELTY